jgi:hypothetical protein
MSFIALRAIVLAIFEMPEVQTDISIAKQRIIEAIESEMANSSQEESITTVIRQLGCLIIKKIKGVFSMNLDLKTAEMDAKEALESTAGQAAVKQVESTVSQAVVSQLDTTNSGSYLSQLIQKANNKITELEAEEAGNSKSLYVKDVRDPSEVIILRALITLASNGASNAIAEIEQKLASL